MQKRILSACMSFVLLLSFVPAAFAASDEAISSANALYQLGLFNGTGTDANGNPIFDLDRTPTRFESVTMLVRLLGRASEAGSNTYTTPFTDVVAWASPYVGYAYANGLTSGTSGTTYGGAGNTTVSQYLTFVLRSLGYESGTDFQWDKAWELSDKIGLTDGRYNAGTTNFTRGDVVIISYNALSINLKGKDTTLLDDLTARGVIKEQHTHDWDERFVEEVGHYESSGTHQVLVNFCGCGAVFRSDDPDFEDKWLAHRLVDNCRKGCIQGYREVSDGNKWVVDIPAHYETYCTICGATK